MFECCVFECCVMYLYSVDVSIMLLVSQTLDPDSL